MSHLVSGKLGLGTAKYRKLMREAEDLLGLAFIAATVAAGVMLSVVFAAF